MNIGMVVEGTTDALVLMTIINRYYPGQHRYFDLQPSVNHSERGNGWKGVRSWCMETWQRNGSSLEKLLSADTGAPLDLLIIALDADVVVEAELQQDGLPGIIAEVQSPCPPITETIVWLTQVVQRWLQRNDQLPPQVLFVFPAQDMENWTFAALFPEDPLCQNADYECYHDANDRKRHPAYLLTLKKYGKLLKRDGNTIKKAAVKYRQVLPIIAKNLTQVCTICTQAQHFADTLHAQIH